MLFHLCFLVLEEMMKQRHQKVQNLYRKMNNEGIIINKKNPRMTKIGKDCLWQTLRDDIRKH